MAPVRIRSRRDDRLPMEEIHRVVQEIERAKFEIIHRMEEDLPSQPFKAEWEPLERDNMREQPVLEILMGNTDRHGTRGCRLQHIHNM